MIPILRALARLLAFGVIFCRGSLDFLGMAVAASGKPPLAARAAWLHRWSRRLLLSWRIAVECSGDAPATGLVVSNHLSYLDVLVFSSAAPFAFVAKSEVRAWPVIGAIARAAGTIFVNRRSRQAARAANQRIERTLRNATPVVLFAEGTSSDGSSVLPFHSSLVEPAVSLDAVITPACVSYELADGSVEHDICYWRDMVFLPHLLKLLTKERIRARVRFGRPVRGYVGRKEAAVLARQSVVRLLQ